jgi:ABC-2 type transport system ATP-binding protein
VIDNGTLIAEGTSDDLKERVGGERIELKLERSEQCGGAIDALRVLAADAPWSEDGVVIVPVHEHKGAIAEAVRKLDAEGIEIDDISVRRPTLDDVFLTLTGKPPEPEDGDEADTTEQDTGEHERELVA